MFSSRRLLSLGLITAGWVPLTLTPPVAEPPVVLLNEIHAAPLSGSEWVELINPGGSAVDLSGWRIDDDVIGGSSTLLAASTVIEPQQLLVVTLTTAILNNSDADRAQLIDAGGNIRDASPLDLAQAGLSLARVPDGSSDWQRRPPSAGAANLSAESTATSAATADAATATGTAGPIQTAGATATADPTPSPTAGAVSPLPTLGPAYDQLVLTEIAAADDPEWIELLNRGLHALDLQQYTLVRRGTATVSRTLSGLLPAGSRCNIASDLPPGAAHMSSTVVGPAAGNGSSDTHTSDAASRG
jgi:hypothetical protein